MAKKEYVEANKRWLEEKAQEEGVQALPRGIYYKVLQAGRPDGLTSSSCHPKIFVKEFCYFLMSCHQHCLGINLLVQR